LISELTSGRPLIPPARPHTQSSSGSSPGRLPTPPPRSARRGYSAESTNSTHIPPVPARQPSHRPPPTRQDTGLTTEIGQLLGGRPARPTGQHVPWPARTGPPMSMPQTAKSGSVYLPVTLPQDRPIIPPGGLAPAPPPKVRTGKVQGLGADDPGLGKLATGKDKWADRLRSRR